MEFTRCQFSGLRFEMPNWKTCASLTAGTLKEILKPCFCLGSMSNFRMPGETTPIESRKRVLAEAFGEALADGAGFLWGLPSILM